MKVPGRVITSILVGVVLTACMLTSAFANPLATSQQLDTEATAISINKTTAVRTAATAYGNRWYTYVDTLYGPVSAEQQAYFNEALSETTFAKALSARANLNNFPRLFSLLAGPHSWYGMNVPGSRVVFDNPDTIYRSAKIFPGASYLIHGKRAPIPPIDENYSVYDAASATLANIAGTDLAVNVDGTFTITADSSPAGGRLNHLQLNSSASQFFIRNTVKHWGQEVFTTLSLECTSGCNPSASESFDTLVSNVVTAENSVGNATFRAFYNGYIGRALNTLANVTRGGTGGYLATQAQTRGIWSITNNQALIVTANLGGAKYFICPVYNKWMITTDPINHTMTLNNGQSLANANGTYTFVIAARDPGVYNWVDTNGMHEGMTLLRWQGLPSTPPATGNASATMRLVTFATLNASLPAGTVFVTAAQRRQQIADRVASFASRYATDPSDSSAATGCIMNPEAGLTWEMVAMGAASLVLLMFRYFRNRKE